MLTRRTRPFALAILLALALPGASGAQTPSAPAPAGAQASPCPPNAALAYWRAWNGRFPQIWDNKYLEEEFRAFDANWVPSPPVASVLEGAQSDIATVMKAAHMEFCDWGVPVREEGFETGFPHLAKLRTTTRVLVADARRLTQKGDIAGAAERLASILLMSRHGRSDKTVYTVITCQRIAADFSLVEMRRLAEAGKLDRASRAILLDALNKVAGPDPWGMREALREEPQVLRASIRRLCTGPDAAKTLIQKFAPQAKPEEKAQSGIEQLKEKEIYDAADRMSVMYEEVLANWDSPNSVEAIRAIDADKKAGTYGGVAVLVGSDLPNSRRIVRLIERHVEETVRQVKGEPPSLPTTPPSNPK